MNLLAEATIKINKPVSVVFDYVSNMENFSEWFPGVISIESENEYLHGQIGKEYLERVKIPLRGVRKIKLTVKEASINRKFVTQGAFAPLLPRMEISLTEDSHATSVVNWRLYSRNNNFIAKLILLPLVSIVMRKRAAKGVGILKVVLEG